MVANIAGSVISSNAVLTVNSAATSTLPGPQDYFVDPNCLSAYPTIQLAVNAVSGQSATNRANIYIAPGTYTELVTVTNPYVSFIGLGDSPTNVFITFAGVQFWYPTVTIAAPGLGAPESADPGPDWVRIGYWAVAVAAVGVAVEFARHASRARRPDPELVASRPLTVKR